MDAITATLILGIVTAVFTFLGIIVTGIVTVMLAKMAREQKEVQKEIAVIHATTNGMSEKLATANINQGLAQGTLDERERVFKEQVTKDLAVLEERARVESGSTVAQVNGTIAENVKTVKEDVGVVKGNVSDIHTEVVKTVQIGVEKGIKDASKNTPGGK